MAVPMPISMSISMSMSMSMSMPMSMPMSMSMPEPVRLCPCGFKDSFACYVSTHFRHILTTLVLIRNTFFCLPPQARQILFYSTKLPKNKLTSRAILVNIVVQTCFVNILRCAGLWGGVAC